MPRSPLRRVALGRRERDAAGLRAGVGQGRHHAADRLLPRRLDARRPRRRRPAHAPVRARARARARRAQGRARRRSTCSWSPAGWSSTSARPLAARGFSERNILISASHTHSGPGGYANFPTLNTAAPSLQTATDPLSLLPAAQPRARRPPALHASSSSQIATAIAPRRRRPRRRRRPAGARARILGPDPQPQPRGAPRQPRHRARVRRRAGRPTTRAATSTRSTRP